MDDEYIHISLLYFLYDYNEFNWKLNKNCTRQQAQTHNGYNHRWNKKEVFSGGLTIIPPGLLNFRLKIYSYCQWHFLSLEDSFILASYNEDVFKTLKSKLYNMTCSKFFNTSVIFSQIPDDSGYETSMFSIPVKYANFLKSILIPNGLVKDRYVFFFVCTKITYCLILKLCQ